VIIAVAAGGSFRFPPGPKVHASLVGRTSTSNPTICRGISVTTTISGSPSGQDAATSSTSISTVPKPSFSPISTCPRPKPSSGDRPSPGHTYTSPGAAFEAFTDPLIAELAKERGEKPPQDTLLEIRADPGHQTIVPPSVADNEQRTWHGDRVAPRVLPAADLRRAAVWLAIGCLVMRHVGEYAAQRPQPKNDGELFSDLPTLLFEAEPVLGRKAFHWLGLPAPDDPPAEPDRPRRSRRWLVTKYGDVELAEIVEAIPNDLGWEDWNAYGLRIYAASDGSADGYVIFDDFSRKSAKYHKASVDERWANYGKSPPSRTGIAKLVKLARAHGWRARP
jgi:Primase C terminal 2 (PriCT-2)